MQTRSRKRAGLVVAPQLKQGQLTDMLNQIKNTKKMPHKASADPGRTMPTSTGQEATVSSPSLNTSTIQVRNQKKRKREEFEAAVLTITNTAGSPPQQVSSEDSLKDKNVNPKKQTKRLQRKPVLENYQQETVEVHVEKP